MSSAFDPVARHDVRIEGPQRLRASEQREGEQVNGEQVNGERVRLSTSSICGQVRNARTSIRRPRSLGKHVRSARTFAQLSRQFNEKVRFATTFAYSVLSAPLLTLDSPWVVRVLVVVARQ